MRDITVAVDAMGGDNAPGEIVNGAVKAAKMYNYRQILVGNKNLIQPLLDKHSYSEDSITLFNSTESIGMDESPKKAIEAKPDSSILRAAELVSSGKADALVSAGSTGSVVLASARHIKRIEGVKKTAIAAFYPTMNKQNRDGNLALLLDIGANINCTSEEIAQFAYMGAAYIGNVCEINDPKVALLNIGEEETKGNDVLINAYRIMKDLPNLNFTGNIEGKDILKGVVDVIVTDGIMGNIVIKTLEGMGKSLGELGKKAAKHKLIWKFGLLMLYKGLQIVKKATDYSEYGGAPLLGFEKMIIISHGRSNAKAIANAVKLAGKCVKDDVCGKIGKNIKNL